jgi:urease accessory protein
MDPRRLLILLAAMLVAANAWAHAGHFTEATFAFGFIHPWIGLDHALAAVAVGLWASAQRIGSRWKGPAVFVGSMIAGALSAHSLGAPSYVDAGIAGSLILLGGLLLAERQLPAAPGLAGIAVFAVLHGLAHGAEAPESGSWPLYLAGLAVGTLLLHLVGLLGGRLVRVHVPRLWPALAIALSIVGAWLLATS